VRAILLLALVAALTACGGASTKRVSSGGRDYGESFDATIQSIRLTD